MAPREQTPLRGNGSQQDPLLAFGDITVPLSITGPQAEFNLGFFGPRDGQSIKYDAVAGLAQAPSALAAFVTTHPGTQPGSVLVKVWTSAFAAAAGSTVTQIRLLATRGSRVAK